jgi:allantoinase
MKPSSYGPFPYSPIIERPRLEWPNGAHVALWIIPNLEYFSLQERPGGYGPDSKIPDVVMWSERDYGNRVGVFRLMDTMERYGMRGTVALNSSLCAEHPQIIAEGNKRKWEWMGHNESNTRRLNEAPPGEEKNIIRRTLDTIGKASGRRPTGWLSSGLQQTWDTLDLLAAEGVVYQCDWCNDDQPYVMSLEGGRSIIAMPYSQQLNDKSSIERRYVSGDGFCQMICDSFDVLYKEGAKSGRVMAIALHPYLIGVPHRIAALDKALKYISKHKKVWKATGSEIAQHYLAQAKDGGAAKAKPARKRA